MAKSQLSASPPGDETLVVPSRGARSPSPSRAFPPSSPGAGSPSVLTRPAPILSPVSVISSSVSPVTSAPGSPLGFTSHSISPPRSDAGGPTAKGKFSRGGSASPPPMGSPDRTSPPSPTAERSPAAFEATLAPPASGGGGGLAVPPPSGQQPHPVIDDFLSFTAAAQAGHHPPGHGPKPSVSSFGSAAADAETASIFERDVEYEPGHVLSAHEALDVAIPPVLTGAVELLTSDEAAAKDIDDLADLVGQAHVGAEQPPAFAQAHVGPSPLTSPHAAGSAVGSGGAVSPTGWSSPGRRPSGHFAPGALSGPGSSLGSPKNALSSRSSPSPPPPEGPSSGLSTPPTQYSPPVFVPLSARKSPVQTGLPANVPAVSEADSSPAVTAAMASTDVLGLAAIPGTAGAPGDVVLPPPAATLAEPPHLSLDAALEASAAGSVASPLSLSPPPVGGAGEGTLHQPQPRPQGSPGSSRKKVDNRLSWISYADLVNEERIAASGPSGVVHTAGGVPVEIVGTPWGTHTHSAAVSEVGSGKD